MSFGLVISASSIPYLSIPINGAFYSCFLLLSLTWNISSSTTMDSTPNVSSQSSKSIISSDELIIENFVKRLYVEIGILLTHFVLIPLGHDTISVFIKPYV